MAGEAAGTVAAKTGFGGFKKLTEYRDTAFAIGILGILCVLLIPVPKQLLDYIRMVFALVLLLWESECPNNIVFRGFRVRWQVDLIEDDGDAARSRDSLEKMSASQ